MNCQHLIFCTFHHLLSSSSSIYINIFSNFFFFPKYRFIENTTQKVTIFFQISLLFFSIIFFKNSFTRLLSTQHMSKETTQLKKCHFFVENTKKQSAQYKSETTQHKSVSIIIKLQSAQSHLRFWWKKVTVEMMTVQRGLHRYRRVIIWWGARRWWKGRLVV